VSRLKEKYISEVKPAMQEKFSYSNVMEIPKIEKISVNMGVGRAVEDKKLIDYAVKDLTIITGQKPIINKARRSVSNFKLRAGMPIGCKVTLRGERMYNFLDKLISINLPRVRDFRGISPEAFDGRGNYTLGVKEQLIFPEIRYDQVQHVQGMNITIVTTANTDEEARELLTLMGMPFKR
jgi:large subunit ribosomal protein L5